MLTASPLMSGHPAPSPSLHVPGLADHGSPVFAAEVGTNEESHILPGGTSTTELLSPGLLQSLPLHSSSLLSCSSFSAASPPANQAALGNEILPGSRCDADAVGTSASFFSMLGGRARNHVKLRSLLPTLKRISVEFLDCNIFVPD